MHRIDEQRKLQLQVQLQETVCRKNINSDRAKGQLNERGTDVGQTKAELLLQRQLTV